MKKVYTSNYSRCGSNPDAVAISASPPEGFKELKIGWLAPNWNLVESYKLGNMSEDEYRKQYIDQLKNRNLTAQKIWDKLPDGIILMCFEKPGDFCHRRVLAEWIESEVDGASMPEWKSPEELTQERTVDSLLTF